MKKPVKVTKEISQYFKEMGKKSWQVRKDKMKRNEKGMFVKI